jgi:TetR/AcrR family transcriptional regulator, tetracycline repressor protein
VSRPRTRLLTSAARHIEYAMTRKVAPHHEEAIAAEGSHRTTPSLRRQKLRQGMARPSQPLISRDAAVIAALEIIDAEGLEEFSLPKLARRLGVSAPSLYHHFTDKNEILSSVVKYIVGKSVSRRQYVPSEDWTDFFVARALNFRQAMLRHRNAAPILLEHLPSEILVRSAEEAAQFLSDSGIPVHLHVQILDGVETIVFGAVLAEAVRKSQSHLLAGVDTRSRPYLTKALAAHDMSVKTLYAQRIRTFLHGIMHEAAACEDTVTRRSTA